VDRKEKTLNEGSFFLTKALKRRNSILKKRSFAIASTEINSLSPPLLPPHEYRGNYLDPLILKGSLFTRGLNHPILAEVTIYLLGSTSLFWIVSRPSIAQAHSFCLDLKGQSSEPIF